MLAQHNFVGEAELTNEQYEQRNKKFKLYEKYGIPYGTFDGTPEIDIQSFQKDKDRQTAISLIMQGKEIPEDLKKLLHYKQEDEIRKRQEKQTV